MGARAKEGTLTQALVDINAHAIARAGEDPIGANVRAGFDNADNPIAIFEVWAVGGRTTVTLPAGLAIQIGLALIQAAAPVKELPKVAPPAIVSGGH